MQVVFIAFSRNISDMDLQTCLKKNLKSLRKSKGFSQESLAEACGVSAQHISDLETGRRWGSLEMFKAIAEALDVPETLLFKDNSIPLSSKDVLDIVKEALSSKREE